jgi:hypothetical protein
VGDALKAPNAQLAQERDGFRYKLSLSNSGLTFEENDLTKAVTDSLNGMLQLR